jgi:hypothetical protein
MPHPRTNPQVKSREAQLEQLKGQLAAATAHAEKEAETRSQQLAQVCVFLLL